MLEAEQILESIINNMTAGIAILEGPDLRYVRINQTLADLNGHPIEYHIGKPIIKVLPDAEKNLIAVMHKIMEDGKAVLGLEFSISLQKNLEKPIHLKNYLFPIPDKQGKVAGISVVVLDITQRKEAEEGLKKSGERYRTLINSIPDVIWISDLKGKTSFISANVEKIYGYTPEEIYDSGSDVWFSRIHTDDQEMVQNAWELLFAGESEFDVEYRIKHKEGKWIWLHDRALSLRRRKDIQFAYGLFSDITKRKQIENELWESEKRYKMLYTKTPTMMHSIDADSKLVDVNDCWLQEFGYKRREVIGINVVEFLTMASKRFAVNSALPEFKRKGYANDVSYQFVKKNGEIMDILLSAVGEIDSKGKFKRSIAVLNNITERKLTEEELKQSHDTLESIASIQSKFISESTRSEIFDELLDDMLSMSESQLGFLGEVREESDHEPSLKNFAISSIAWHNNWQKYMEENYEPGLEFTYFNFLISKVIKTGKPVISNNPSKAQRSGGLSKRSPVLKSYIGLPLYVGEKLVGVVGLANSPSGYNHKILDNLEPYIKTTANIVRSFKLDRHRIEAENELKESQEQLRNLSTRIQSVREEERKNVAYEIHDELGQALTALNIELTSLIGKFPENGEKFSNEVKSIIDLVDRTADTVRKISTKLRPGILDVLGLIPAIEWQSEEFQERTNIRCSVITNKKDVKLNKDVSTAVFRIFQEALTNVIRHSKATKVKVRLKQDKDKFELIIIDNGIGITEEEKNNPASFGLMAMRERLYPWQGILSINGKESKGTTLSVIVPNNA